MTINIPWSYRRPVKRSRGRKPTYFRWTEKTSRFIWEWGSASNKVSPAKRESELSALPEMQVRQLTHQAWCLHHTPLPCNHPALLSQKPTVDSRCAQSSDKHQSGHRQTRPLPSPDQYLYGPECKDSAGQFLPTSHPSLLYSLPDGSPHLEQCLRLRCSLDQPLRQRCNSRAEQDSTLTQLWRNSTLSDSIKYCFRSRSLWRHSGQTTFPTSLCEEFPGNQLGLFLDLSLATHRSVWEKEAYYAWQPLGSQAGFHLQIHNMRYMNMSRAFDRNIRVSGPFLSMCCDFNLTTPWKKNQHDEAITSVGIKKYLLKMIFQTSIDVPYYALSCLVAYGRRTQDPRLDWAIYRDLISK